MVYTQENLRLGSRCCALFCAPPMREGFPGIGDLGLVSGDVSMEAGMSEQDKSEMTLLQRAPKMTR